MYRVIFSVVQDKKGIAALEYALLAGLIFAAIIGATAALGPLLSSAFSNIGSSILSRDTGS
jgi:pilus assembly protein Flp/PilA